MVNACTERSTAGSRFITVNAPWIAPSKGLHRIWRFKTDMRAQNRSKVLGYIADSANGQMFRLDEACVVAGQEGTLRRYIATLPREIAEQLAIRKVRFGDILDALGKGGEYVFDEPSYARFQPLAAKAGLDVKPEEFPMIDDSQMHFVKVVLAPEEQDDPDAHWEPR